MIDVLYVSFNRLRMTIASFEALVKNTDWELVNRLYVLDDDSSDGTADWLDSAVGHVDTEVIFERRYFGGPVAAMNRYLELAARAHRPRRQWRRDDMFAKVDNDFVMPYGWLGALAWVMDGSPELDIVGTEPFLGLDAEPEFDLRSSSNGRLLAGYTPCRHIGGKGLIRCDAFDGRPMYADGRQGFTQWQHKHEEVTKGWITPDLQSFGLDQLPFEPWVSLTEEYVSRGWQRPWPKYQAASHDYWDWWLKEQGDIEKMSVPGATS